MGLIFEERTRRLKAQLHPELVDAWDRVISLWLSQFPGCSAGISQGYRTPSQQAAFHSIGTTPLDGVTSFSKHQFWPSHAMDAAILDESGKLDWDESSLRWEGLGGLLKIEGLVWGRDFSRPDSDHFEVPGGYPTAEEVTNGYLAFVNLGEIDG